MDMSKADQIQIGMLGVIIVLMLVNMSGIFSNSDANLAAEARQELVGPSASSPNAVNPMASNPAAPSALPPTTTPTAPKVDPNVPKTVMAFTEETFDFGTVTEGEKVKHTFKFKNTGKEPLIINDAKGSCGCTVPKWPRTPVAPGATGEVTVEFNSDKKVGKRNQQVTITANTEPANTIIRLVGNVNAKGGAEAAGGGVSPIQVNPGGGK